MLYKGRGWKVKDEGSDDNDDLSLQLVSTGDGGCKWWGRLRTWTYNLYCWRVLGLSYFSSIYPGYSSDDGSGSMNHMWDIILWLLATTMTLTPLSISFMIAFARLGYLYRSFYFVSMSVCLSIRLCLWLWGKVPPPSPSPWKKPMFTRVPRVFFTCGVEMLRTINSDERRWPDNAMLMSADSSVPQAVGKTASFSTNQTINPINQQVSVSLRHGKGRNHRGSRRVIIIKDPTVSRI